MLEVTWPIMFKLYNTIISYLLLTKEYMSSRCSMNHFHSGFSFWRSR